MTEEVVAGVLTVNVPPPISGKDTMLLYSVPRARLAPRANERRFARSLFPPLARVFNFREIVSTRVCVKPVFCWETSGASAVSGTAASSLSELNTGTFPIDVRVSRQSWQVCEHALRLLSQPLESRTRCPFPNPTPARSPLQMSPFHSPERRGVLGFHIGCTGSIGNSLCRESVVRCLIYLVIIVY